MYNEYILRLSPDKTPNCLNTGVPYFLPLVEKKSDQKFPVAGPELEREGETERDRERDERRPLLSTPPPAHYWGLSSMRSASLLSSKIG